MSDSESVTAKSLSKSKAAGRAGSIAPKAAHVYLPKLSNPPSTIFQYLCNHFPQVGDDVWDARIKSGKVLTCGIAVTPTTPYQHGITVAYFREVGAEAEIPFQEEIIFEDDHLLVADKPHFLPVTPAGQSVNECLLYRLQRRTGVSDLAPLHRLDRDTAGLVLFSKVKAERRRYAELFASQKIERIYFAVAALTGQAIPAEGHAWKVENRLERGDPWFRMKAAAGLPGNASTHISLKKVREGRALFELRPQTGKKHQLRIHLMSIGFPVLNDCFYPELQFQAADYSKPLQLLAAHIAFKDPIAEKPSTFESKRLLSGWEGQM